MRNAYVALALASALLPGCGGGIGYSSPATYAQDPPAVTRDYAPNMDFDGWIAAFRTRAEAQGIRPQTLDAALLHAGYDEAVIARDRNQSEFTRSVWDYLDGAVSDVRIANGRQALAQNRELLNLIQRRYGVDPEVVVAVWGMESSYGAQRGTTAIIPALATLAYDGRRGAFFEEQLVAALRIIQAGDIDAAHMTGSWAGAMGHTQFMPTSYLTYAVDFTGDGRRDIWSNDPADALASTAAYLQQSGWRAGEPWGLEVTLPPGFNMGLIGKGTTYSTRDWAEMGVRNPSGGGLPYMADTSIILPAGVRGPALLIGRNFAAISAYNASDSYVIGVGHLADRLRGEGPFVHPWPRGDRALSTAEREELQQRLTAAGYDTQGTDGKIGPNTVDALRAWQAARGLVPDGYPSVAVLERIRKG